MRDMEDWTGVPYPPWWIARAAERRAALDRAVARLRERVPATPHLVGVLVFGSYVAGRVGPESDLDLIAVTRDPEPTRANRYLALMRRFALDVPCDLIVYDPTEYTALSSEPFVGHARESGMWIDAAPSR